MSVRNIMRLNKMQTMLEAATNMNKNNTLAFKHSWGISVNYTINDIVTHNGSSYISIKSDNLGYPPTNKDYWAVLATRGSNGLNGIAVKPKDAKDGKDGKDGHIIIQYSSKTVGTVNSLQGGISGPPLLVGSDSSIKWGTKLDGSIDLTDFNGNMDDVMNLPFNLPLEANIRSINVHFTVTDKAIPAVCKININAQLYSCNTNDNIFIPINGTSVVCTPDLTFNTEIETTFKGILTNIDIPSMPIGTRLLILFTAKSAGGVPIASSVTGYFSGSILLN